MVQVPFCLTKIEAQHVLRMVHRCRRTQDMVQFIDLTVGKSQGIISAIEEQTLVQKLRPQEG